MSLVDEYVVFILKVIFKESGVYVVSFVGR